MTKPLLPTAQYLINSSLMKEMYVCRQELKKDGRQLEE